MALSLRTRCQYGVILLVESDSPVDSQRTWLKATFNLAQISLGFSTGILAYRWAGGVPFLNLAGESFLSLRTHRGSSGHISCRGGTVRELTDCQRRNLAVLT